MHYYITAISVQDFKKKEMQDKLLSVFNDKNATKETKIKTLLEVIDSYVEKENLTTIDERTLPNILADTVDKLGFELDDSEIQKIWNVIPKKKMQGLGAKAPDYVKTPYRTITNTVGAALVVLLGYYIFFNKIDLWAVFFASLASLINFYGSQKEY